MPTYQYACTQCDHRFEQVQAFTDDALTACPECGGSLRKVYSAVGVVFKGSGFYRNDSRPESSGSKPKDGNGKDGSKDGSKDGGVKQPAVTSSGDSSSSGTGDAKPAAAAASSGKPAAASSAGSSGSSTSQGAA